MHFPKIAKVSVWGIFGNRFWKDYWMVNDCMGADLIAYNRLE